MSPLEQKIYDYIIELEPEKDSIRKRINIQLSALELNLRKEDLTKIIYVLIKDGYLKEFNSGKLWNTNIEKDSNKKQKIEIGTHTIIVMENK